MKPTLKTKTNYKYQQKENEVLWSPSSLSDFIGWLINIIAKFKKFNFSPVLLYK